MRLRPLLAAPVLAVLVSACVTHYRPIANPSLADLSPAEKSQVLAQKFSVPCSLSVNASDDMVGQNTSVMDGTPFGFKDLYHYPLRQVMNDCFNSVVYSAFDQPKGNVLDSFSLNVEPQSSILSINGSSAQFKLLVYATIYEPGGKKLASYNIDRVNFGVVRSENEVPEVVYTTIKEVAIEVMKKIAADPRVMATVARFSDR